MYVFDINQPSFSTPAYSVRQSLFVFMVLSAVFHSRNSPDSSPLSHSVLPILFLPYWPRSGELQMQKLKSHVVRTQSLNVLPLEPGVGQYIVIRTTLTARDFFLVYSILLVYSPAFFPKPLQIFPVLAVANTWFLCRPAE